ncbi:O-antigen polymerase [uncultured Aquimarina sp.]|uniref:O-antigen polymerase n=1 Tax=uncultured Aquimarina sp. TaxID=575652 RepID=UPI0026302E8A|nr:O-antigen polymerase [uncultured Aquimarina sp.]
MLALSTFYFLGTIDYGITLEYNQKEIASVAKIAVVLFFFTYHSLMISKFDVKISVEKLKKYTKEGYFNHTFLIVINALAILINLAVIIKVLLIIGHYSWGDEYRHVLGRVIPGELTIFGLIVIILFHFNTLFFLGSKGKTRILYILFNLLIVFEVFQNSSRSSFVFLFVPSVFLILLLNSKNIFRTKYIVIGLTLLLLSSFWGYYRLVNRPNIDFEKIVANTGFPTKYIAFYDAVVTFRGSVEIYNKAVCGVEDFEYGGFLFRPVKQFFDKKELGSAQYVAIKYIGKHPIEKAALPPTLVGGFYLDFGLLGSIIGPLLMLILLSFFKKTNNIVVFGLLYTYLLTYYMISIYGNFFNNIGFPLTLVIYVLIGFLVFKKYKLNINEYSILSKP